MRIAQTRTTSPPFLASHQLYPRCAHFDTDLGQIRNSTFDLLTPRALSPQVPHTSDRRRSVLDFPVTSPCISRLARSRQDQLSRLARLAKSKASHWVAAFRIEITIVHRTLGLSTLVTTLARPCDVSNLTYAKPAPTANQPTPGQPSPHLEKVAAAESRRRCVCAKKWHTTLTSCPVPG
jgi:hypothetical protein